MDGDVGDVGGERTREMGGDGDVVSYPDCQENKSDLLRRDERTEKLRDETRDEREERERQNKNGLQKTYAKTVGAKKREVGGWQEKRKRRCG